MAPRRRDRRHLHNRGSVWYFECVIDGRRYRQSMDTANLEEAKARRDAIERKLAATPFIIRDTPTFGVAAREALAAMEVRRSMGTETGYAATTARDRIRALRTAGPILPHLGHLRLDAIGVAILHRWHDAEVVQRGLSLKTGNNLLDAIEQVFRFARSREFVDRSHKPVTVFREEIRSETRTKRSRAAVNRRRNLARDGVLSPEEVGRLTAAARGDDLESFVIVLLVVECGLRRGEIFGLRWGDVAFGDNEDDPTRLIEIRESRSRGLDFEAPKSGQIRRPHLSRRLRQALTDLNRARWGPGPEKQIVRASYWGLSELVLRRVLRSAGLPHRTLQNLRATCSSLLKQWGVTPEYVRVAIGHETDAVARQYYDRIDFTTYRPPEQILRGETPMDLFARLCVEPDPSALQPLSEQVARSSTRRGEQVRARAGNERSTPPRVPSPRTKPQRIRGVEWRPQRDSNPSARQSDIQRCGGIFFGEQTEPDSGFPAGPRNCIRLSSAEEWRKTPALGRSCHHGSRRRRTP